MYNFCLRQCVYVFVIQTMIAIYFGWDYRSFDRFSEDDWNFYDVTARVLCSIMLQIVLNEELSGAVSKMAWFKYQRVNAKNQTSRYISLLLCFMQAVAPIMT